MCHLCEARKHLNAMKEISAQVNDPIIQADVRCLENLLVLRQALDQNAALCAAVIKSPNANEADRERFGVVLDACGKIADVITELSAKMAKLTRQDLAMSEATLDTTTGKGH